MRAAEHHFAIKIPDATPQMVQDCTLGDGQILLAIVRYNRLIDIFLGITACSLQTNLRTQVQGMGQIEIDEIYVGLNRRGAQLVIPVQVDDGSDELLPVRTMQHIAYCQARFPDLICRPICAQFAGHRTIALFELTIQDGRAWKAQESHYRLVPAGQIDSATKRLYAHHS